MNFSKKILALGLCASLVLAGGAVPSGKADAAAKVKISKKTLTLKVGNTAKLALKKGTKKVAFKKWKTSNSKVATVSKAGKVKGISAGKAVISAKYKKKTYKCKVTIKANAASSGSGSQSNTVVSAAPAATAGAKVTIKPVEYTTPVPGTITPVPGTITPAPTDQPSITIAPVVIDPVEDNGFNFADDVTYEDSSRMTTVEFEINTETTSKAELEEAGYTVNGSTASKDTICETRTYTFKKLPNTLRGLQTIPLDGAYEVDESIDGNEAAEGGIGFNTMVATLCTVANFRGYSNPSDPFGDKDGKIQEIKKMFEYLNGPREADNISNARWQTAVDSMKNATATNNSGNPNVYLSYFGAKSSNFYADPGEGNYEVTLYRGPYMIPEKTTINGKRPTTYMIFVGTGEDGNDWGTDRYLDVWKSSDGNWYSWKDVFLNVVANNFVKAEEGF